MKTLQEKRAVEELVGRLGQMRAETAPKWGRMNAGQMVRHLLDSFALALGERPAEDVSTWGTRNVVKLLALRAPMPWPKGVPTRPEVDQEKLGTRPGEFARELAELEAVVRRFAQEDCKLARHPMFGEMSAWEWRRWGWLHVDHHLRQFGC